MIEDHDYEGRPHHRGIHIVNPFDSWAQLGLLPSSTTLSADAAIWHKLYDYIIRIAMNNSVAVAIWSYDGYHLAYTRLGIDHAWIHLKGTLTSGKFRDVVAYKDDLFCALDQDARKVVALDFSSPHTVRSTDLTLNLPAYRDSNDGWTCFQDAQLVNSSSKLFLVRWRSLVKVGETKRRVLDIHKLMDDDDDADKKWVPIRSLGNSSFFLGLNQSISLSTATFPKLRTNCIYIPRDAVYRVSPENDMYPATWEDDDDLRTHLICDLGDEGLDEYYPSEPFYGLWMTPRLPSKSTC
ncbi:uncharacterized protein A4U43_C02F14390 [Asparagus officinalis]|uniref:KIB1-4 beta-propeller domain-containing protein n=1 Tax=Asparagus officinalis TaxID=4686 RepID=A0A5P1FK53_ASPOF|nr:uncharacterized protein A4U43_C02F14390 [Asparagus officinalis]